ncbi:MAG TPA: SAM-dependent methyltransferase, partial [Thermoplasmatales archaeon]|nr:SAM-dependent methyltransferase [Thermoplasmatales archaeon]
MPRVESFERYSKEYDEWFIKNRDVYLAEVNAVKGLIPSGKFGVEVGVGTGRFAIPLGIKVGVEPSKRMAEIAKERGVQVYRAVAEALPFKEESFDFVLMVTTICFVDDLLASFKEAYRVLKTKGFIIVGFVDKESELGKQYQLKREKSKFYKHATFYSVREVMDFLRRAGFEITIVKQTVFSLGNIMDLVEEGYGRGSFIVI